MSNRDIRKRSQLQEKRAAKDVGGRIVAGSGAAKFSGGGDVRKQGELRVECKFTHKPAYNLKLADMAKIRTQAIEGGLEFPVMQIEFVSAPTLKLAVFFEQPRYPVQKQTQSKSVSLRRDDVLRLLLGKPSYQIKFHSPRMGEHTVTVMRWTSFLEKMEEENNAGD